MIPGLCMTLTISHHLFHTAVSSLRVEISPKRPLFRVGDRQELTCRPSDCSMKTTFSWGSLEDKPLYAEAQTSSTESTLTFKSVEKKNENRIMCKATCRGESGQASVTVKVYSFPKDPVLFGHDSLVLGKENTLTCEVSDVYPAEYMKVEWLRGDEVVHAHDGEYGAESIRSSYTFTPQIEDKGKPVTCRATFNLNGLPLEEKTRETTVSMSVDCPPVNTVISLSPDNPKEMELMNISCVSDSNPTSLLVLNKVLDGEEIELVSGVGPQVSVLYHSANSSHSGVYVCTATHICGKQMDSINVTVGTHPLEVSLQPDRSFISVDQGSSMMLSCNSTGCPYANITWKNVTHRPVLSWDDAQAFVSQIGPWTVGLEDNRTFICEVKCGSVVKSKRTELKVFSPAASAKDTTEEQAKLPVVIGLGVLAFVVGLLICVRKAGKKGLEQLGACV